MQGVNPSGLSGIKRENIWKTIAIWLVSFDIIILSILHWTTAFASSVIIAHALCGSQFYIVSNSCPSTLNIHPSIKIFWRCEPIWDLNITLLFTLYFLRVNLSNGIHASFLYSLLAFPWLLPPPDICQYHDLLPWIIGYQVDMNGVACLSEYGQSGCRVSHQETSK
jgi:hypothetical protein